MSTKLHQRICQEIARSTLADAGIAQKGRSRLWYDDRAWFATCIEFQPSSGRNGSYLNVGLTWLWEPREYWSFDVGGRLGGFIEYSDEATFAFEFSKMAKLALDRAVEIRTLIATPKDAYSMMERNREMAKIWRSFHLGVAAGLLHERDVAKKHFGDVIQPTAGIEWINKLGHTAKELMAVLDMNGDFKGLIERRISAARALLKLPSLLEPTLSP